MNNAETVFRHELVRLLPRMWRFALSLTGGREACHDLVQATCERALARFYQWQASTRLDSWVFSIMHSIWVNELRSQSIRRGAGFVDPDALVFENALGETEVAAEHAEIYRAVQNLPEAQRTALLLVYVEGYSYQEAAELLAVPVGTVMSRLARGRISLADHLKQKRPAAALSFTRNGDA
jgi:RNA polymerase sigma-70 factor (ECF subfamily)